MRMLISDRVPKLPMQDCEFASRMIRLFERRPRANRHRVSTRPFLSLALSACLLAVLGTVLVVLGFTF